jgi:hypothetical protein
MKIMNTLVAVGLFASAAMSVGCGPNPCQDLTDAIATATAKQGCSMAIKPITNAFMTVDPNNCTASDQQSDIDEAEVICFNAVKSCDGDSLTTLGVCLANAGTAK